MEITYLRQWQCCALLSFLFFVIGNALEECGYFAPPPDLYAVHTNSFNDYVVIWFFLSLLWLPFELVAERYHQHLRQQRQLSLLIWDVFTRPCKWIARLAVQGLCLVCMMPRSVIIGIVLCFVSPRVLAESKSMLRGPLMPTTTQNGDHWSFVITVWALLVVVVMSVIGLTNNGSNARHRDALNSLKALEFARWFGPHRIYDVKRIKSDCSVRVLYREITLYNQLCAALRKQIGNRQIRVGQLAVSRLVAFFPLFSFTRSHNKHVSFFDRTSLYGMFCTRK